MYHRHKLLDLIVIFIFTDHSKSVTLGVLENENAKLNVIRYVVHKTAPCFA
jgi:hypothetical protein